MSCCTGPSPARSCDQLINLVNYSRGLLFEEAVSHSIRSQVGICLDQNLRTVEGGGGCNN